MERSFFVINDIHLIHKQAIYIKKDFVLVNFLNDCTYLPKTVNVSESYSKSQRVSSVFCALTWLLCCLMSCSCASVSRSLFLSAVISVSSRSMSELASSFSSICKANVALIN